MARVSHTAGKTPILPRGTAESLRKRLIQAGGVLLLAGAVAFALALLSFHPGDASLNTASDGTANLLGTLGAAVSDLFLQSVGLAAMLPVLVLAAWGWLILDGDGITHTWARLLLMIGVLVFAATGFAAIPVSDTWPLRSGLGGVAGGIGLDRSTELIAGLLSSDAAKQIPVRALLAGLAGLLALTGLFFCLGLKPRHWRTVGHAGRRAGTGVFRAGRWTAQKTKAWNDARLERADLRTRERREPQLVADPRSVDDAPPFETETPLAGNPALTAPKRKKVLVANRKTKAKAGKRAQKERQGILFDDGRFQLPPFDLLDPAPAAAKRKKISEQSLEQNARLLESVLEDFGVRGTIVKVRPGPVVTLYELEPAPGTKTSRVIGLSDDIARSMSAVSVRVAVIPGRNVIGIELPNARRETVYMRELLETADYETAGGGLNLVLGKDIGGAPVITDLAHMPHLLIAGTTGSGKSVAINTMILSLLYRMPPDRCRLIMVDPKMLELSVYDDIPHLLAPVVTDPSKAVVALKWAVREMENRYRSMAEMGVRNITGYNKRLEDSNKKGETLTRRVQTGFDEQGQPIFEEQPLDMNPLPFIVVVVDEMADLMLVAGKDIEAAIQRLAQMARAAGIHLIMATQRPSVDVITGTIKANFPTRISFQVTSKIDSRTILGEQGAEQLLGQGDMLYMAGGGRISRVHGPFVSDEEVEEIVDFLKEQGRPEYIESVTEEDENAPPILGMNGTAGSGPAAGGGSAEDVLYDQAVAVIAREGKASTSFIQRHLQIGYNRAARIIERMEAEGVVSKANRVGKREVLIGHHGD